MQDAAGQSDASTSDSDSDFVQDVSEADMHAILALEGRLEANPNLYDAHVQLIEVLRRCRMRERLREARRAMQARFPLTEALWAEWAADEIEAAQGPEDVQRIQALFEDAVQDYLSIPLWCQYIE